MKQIFFVGILLAGLAASGQDNMLSLEKCYTLARQNYPLIRKQDLISKTSEYSLENAGKGWLPQFSFSGQATYQSETINFQKATGIGNGSFIPPLSKDQYKIQAEVDQNIYDGGRIRHDKELIEANEAIEQQSLEVSLYQLNDRINQIYFSILLIDQQIRQNNITIDNLQSMADKAKASYENGIGLKSNVDEFLAEIATIEMSNISFKANRKAYTDILGIFIARKVDENTVLIMPPALVENTEIKRPELVLYDLSKKIYDIQDEQLKTAYLPKFDAFLQGAYGRPTLNFIDNDFGPWYIGGVRMVWNLGSLYSLKNNRANLKINRESIDIDKETFLYNTQLTQAKQSGDMQKYLSLLKQDEKVIALRSSIVEAAKAQLDNGVVTVHDYIAKTNDENLARQLRILHGIQLIEAQYDFKNTTGN